jgi:hypothetical protein
MALCGIQTGNTLPKKSNVEDSTLEIPAGREIALVAGFRLLRRSRLVLLLIALPGRISARLLPMEIQVAKVQERTSRAWLKRLPSWEVPLDSTRSSPVHQSTSPRTHFSERVGVGQTGLAIALNGCDCRGRQAAEKTVAVLSARKKRNMGGTASILICHGTPLD